jgi:hypothetical protein
MGLVIGLIARLGAYSLDNPGRAIVYTDVFDDIVRQLQESFRKEQAKQITRVSKGLVLYLDEMKGGMQSNSLTPENSQTAPKFGALSQKGKKVAQPCGHATPFLPTGGGGAVEETTQLVSAKPSACIVPNRQF